VTDTYLKRGDLLAVQIIDVELNLFKVTSVRKLGRAGILGWRPGFNGTYLRIEPILQFDRHLSLDAAKKHVIDFVSAHPGVYASSMPIDELSAAVMAADSPRALISLL
jgi:hypothetical protein